MINKRTRVNGWIRSLDTITVESRAIVDSIFAPRVVLEDSVRAQNVYSEELEIEGSVMVTGDFFYSSNLRAGASSRSRSSFPRQPQKVDVYL